LFDDPELETEDDSDSEVTYEDDNPEPGPSRVAAKKVEPEPDPEPETDASADADPVPDDAPPLPVTQYAKLSELLLEYKHWTNPRTITGLEDAKIAELAESIHSRTVQGAGDGKAIVVGLTDPMKIIAIDNNGSVDLLIYDGQRRYLGATKVFGKPGDELVPVVWRYPEPVKWTPEIAHELFVEAVHGVGTREGLSAYELSEIAVRLRAGNDPKTKKPTTLAQIAKDLNRSESWISKILTAREAASPKLLAQWRSGAITEEQFRDLATAKDHGKQEAKAQEVAAARGEGRGASRAVAKEQKLLARQEAKEQPPAKVAKGAKGGKSTDKVVRGPQADLPIAKPAPPAPVGPPRKAMPFAVIEDTVATATKNPPTHDMVKGIILGMKVASGMMDAADLPKPWQKYLSIVARRSQVQARAAALSAAADKSKPKKAKKKR